MIKISKKIKIYGGIILTLCIIMCVYVYAKSSKPTSLYLPNTNENQVLPYYGKVKVGFRNGNSTTESSIEFDEDIHSKIEPNNLYIFDEKDAFLGLMYRAILNKEDLKGFKVIGFNLKFNDKNYDTCIIEDNMSCYEKQNPDGTISKVYIEMFYKNKIMKELQQLQKQGGNLELNAIVTTIKDGKPEGGFDEKLNTWGKVFYSSDELIKNGSWNERDLFKQLFSKKHYFKGVQT